MPKICYNCVEIEGEEEGDKVKTYVLAVPIEARPRVPCQQYVPLRFRNVPFKKASEIPETTMNRNYPDIFWPPKGGPTTLTSGSQQTPKSTESVNHQNNNRDPGSQDFGKPYMADSNAKSWQNSMIKPWDPTISGALGEKNSTANNDAWKNVRSASHDDRSNEVLENQSQNHNSLASNISNVSNRSSNVNNSETSGCKPRNFALIKKQVIISDEATNSQTKTKQPNVYTPFYPACNFSTREYGKAMRNFFGMVGVDGKMRIFAGGLQEANGEPVGGGSDDGEGKACKICVECCPC